jgi:hypothetical protein
MGNTDALEAMQNTKAKIGEPTRGSLGHMKC